MFHNSLSEKDVLIIEDQLRNEQLLITKCMTMANQTQDQQVRNACLQAAQKHQGHYNTLVQHLNQSQF